MSKMTAEELIRRAVTCTRCGKVHQPRKTGNHTSWAGEDGHPYRTLLCQLTGDSHGAAVAALRQIAGLT